MAAAAPTSENLSHDVIDRGPVSAQQLLVVGLCMFFNMLDGFDITAMAVVATSVSTELELTPDKLGWIFSFALAGMMGGAMFLAPVSDIIGRRKLIIMAMTLIGVSIILTASASTLPEFIILRFISGTGSGRHAGMPGCAVVGVQPGQVQGVFGGRGDLRLSAGGHDDIRYCRLHHA